MEPERRSAGPAAGAERSRAELAPQDSVLVPQPASPPAECREEITQHDTHEVLPRTSPGPSPEMGRRLPPQTEVRARTRCDAVIPSNLERSGNGGARRGTPASVRGLRLPARSGCVRQRFTTGFVAGGVQEETNTGNGSGRLLACPPSARRRWRRPAASAMRNDATGGEGTTGSTGNISTPCGASITGATGKRHSLKIRRGVTVGAVM